MLDFTSCLYLGMNHPARQLRPWAQLTTGVPSALAVTPAQRRVEAGLARLTGCEAAALGPSTLHLFWDLFGVLTPQRTAVLVDAGVYPIASWGVERAGARGAVVEVFPHHDADALARAAQRHLGRRILVLADGCCAGCGAPAPVADYLAIAQQRDGLLVLDDTQALGILGRAPSAQQPMGSGGGGTLARLEVGNPRILAVSSMAKGFGVPVAVLGGGCARIERFLSKSETRVHCSPPSIGHIHAAAHALALNRRHGDDLRQRLTHLIRVFRSYLGGLGLHAAGGIFPVQTLICRCRTAALRLHHRLLRSGIRTLLRTIRCTGQAGISFVLTARHTLTDIENAMSGLADAWPGNLSYHKEERDEPADLGHRMA